MSPRAVHAGARRPIPTERGATSQQQVAGFHRERDPRRLLAMARTMAAAGVLVALVLTVVGIRLHQVRLSYRLDGLRSVRAELEEARGRLRVEVDTLRSLARIEGKARTELGMVPPAPDQVQLAREFVSGGNGLGMAAPLTASVDRWTGPARGAR
jgi:cell division protein FtsL